QLGVAEARLASAKASLAKLEQQPRPEELAVSLAKLRAATAKAALWEDQFQRAKQLLARGAISQEEYVTRQLTYEAAVYEKAQAQAEYDLIKAGAWRPDLAIADGTGKEARAG